jgi:hypothetical protein
VPVGIDGLFEIWGRNRPFQWRKLAPGAGVPIRLKIGDPLQPDGAGAAAAGNDATYSMLTSRLRAAVSALWQAIAVRPDAGERRQVS